MQCTTEWMGWFCVFGRVTQHSRRFMCTLEIYLVHLHAACARVFVIAATERCQWTRWLNSVGARCQLYGGWFIYIFVDGIESPCVPKLAAGVGIDLFGSVVWRTQLTHTHGVVVVWHDWHIDQCVACVAFFFFFLFSVLVLVSLALCVFIKL